MDPYKRQDLKGLQVDFRMDSMVAVFFIIKDSANHGALSEELGHIGLAIIIAVPVEDIAFFIDIFLQILLLIEVGIAAATAAAMFANRRGIRSLVIVANLTKHHIFKRM